MKKKLELFIVMWLGIGSVLYLSSLGLFDPQEMTIIDTVIKTSIYTPQDDLDHYETIVYFENHRRVKILGLKEFAIGQIYSLYLVKHPFGCYQIYESRILE